MFKKQKFKRELFKRKKNAKTNFSSIVFDHNQFENIVSTSTSIAKNVMTSIVIEREKSFNQIQTTTISEQNVFESIKISTKIVKERQKKNKKNARIFKTLFEVVRN